MRINSFIGRIWNTLKKKDLLFTILAEYFEVGFAELEFMGIPLGLFYRGRGIGAQSLITGGFGKQAAGEKCKQYDCKQCYFLHDDQKLNQVVRVYTGMVQICYGASTAHT